LAAAACFAGSVLAFRSVTFGTFNHDLILTQVLATPGKQANVSRPNDGFLG
jgi:hypothetical protein